SLSFSYTLPGALSQHAILMELYTDTVGSNWNNNGGWGGGEGTECTWYGVQCNGQNQVTGLILSENNLSGTLPDSLGQLSTLGNLSLYGNEIGGPIPASLGLLSQ